MAAHLSPPTQALLQIIDSVQPFTAWQTAGQANTVTFTPTEVDYNPLRLQEQPYTLMLTHPTNPTTQEFYSIRPPRLRTNARGDRAWAEWWRAPPYRYNATFPSPFPQWQITSQTLLPATSNMHSYAASTHPDLSFQTSSNLKTYTT